MLASSYPAWFYWAVILSPFVPGAGVAALGLLPWSDRVRWSLFGIAGALLLGAVVSVPWLWR